MSETFCVQGERGQAQSSLHISGSWRHTGPGEMEGWSLHLPCRANDTAVKVHHHCLWEVEFLQLPQEVHPLLGFSDERADVQLQLEVLGDDGPQEAKNSTVSTGESHRVIGAGGAGFLL